MAYPTTRSVGSKAGASNTSMYVPAPTGMAADDLEIMIGASEEAHTITVLLGTEDVSGMTRIGSVIVSGGRRLYVWYGTPYLGDRLMNCGGAYCMARMAITAGTFDPTNPVEAVDYGTEVTSDQSFNADPTTSTSGAERLVFIFSSIARDSNTGSIPVCTNSSLTNLVSRANYNTNAGNGAGIGGTEGRMASAGAIGEFACTYATASPKAWISFSVKPEPPPIHYMDWNGAAGTPQTVTSVNKARSLSVFKTARETDTAQVLDKDKYKTLAPAGKFGWKWNW